MSKSAHKSDIVEILRSVSIDTLFESSGVQARAEELFLEGTCTRLSMHGSSVGGEVVGRTGVYSVWVYLSTRGLSFDCSCPSDYYPCKHVGALLYTIQAELDSIPPDELEPTEAISMPATFRPSEIVDTTTYRPRQSEAGNRITKLTELFAALTSTHQNPGAGDSANSRKTESSPPRVSPAAKFRPAFQIVAMSRPTVSNRVTYGIVPVLVYLRKDGKDGRIEPFSRKKQRVLGDETTEGLIAIATRRPDGALNALRLLSQWCDTAPAGEAGFALPIELYHARASHSKREGPVVPRRITALRINWKAVVSTGTNAQLVHSLELTDPSGTQEEIDLRESVPEVDERGLIVPVPGTGSLWYRFDGPGLSEERPRYSVLAVLAELLDLPARLTYQEAMSVADLCREHLPELVTVETPPSEITVVSLSPVPVVCFNPAGVDSTYVSLHFRYGEHVIYPDDQTQQIPLERSEMESLGIHRTGYAAGAWHLAVRSEPAEMYFLGTLAGTISEIGGPSGAGSTSAIAGLEGGSRPTPNASRPAPPYRNRAIINLLINFSRYSAAVEVSGAPWDTVRAVGEGLSAAGFEIRVGEERVRILNGTPRYRVVRSGESFLSIEPGIVAGDHFLLIEEVRARGVVRAAGRTYVIPASSGDSFQIPERLTVGRRDLGTLDLIAEKIVNPDDPALEEYNRLRQRLAAFRSIELVSAPASFTGTLRPYQQAGLSWLWFLHAYGLGGILADDMGLGKTVQALALLALARERNQLERALVVCPVSTMGNWRNECTRFTPQFRSVVHIGPGRSSTVAEFDDTDVVFVSYDTLFRDIELFRSIQLDYLILDEAQAVKNPGAKRRRAISTLDVPHRLALTGTPVENSTIELWSIMDLVMPGILGSRRQFAVRYGGAVMDQTDPDATERLERIIRPLVLRRTKREVAPDLPAREEQIVYAELGSRQASVYESLRARFEAEVFSWVESSGMDESRMAILEAMLRLRQAAILPALVDPDYESIGAAKIDLLVDMLAEIAAEGNKALVFSQFTTVLDEVALRIARLNLPLFRLQGDTPQHRRDQQVSAFQDAPGSACFLISLRAGGLGINLTAADYVLLVDPWWNPAVEAQAIDRAHRIGRDRPVFAYRLVARGTIEEKMLRLQERKRRLAESLIREESGALRSLSVEDLQELFER